MPKDYIIDLIEKLTFLSDYASSQGKDNFTLNLSLNDADVLLDLLKRVKEENAKN